MARTSKSFKTRLPVTPVEFDELKDIYRKLLREGRRRKPMKKPALPFVPYRGPEYGREDDAPRIMYVGMATSGDNYCEKLSINDCSIKSQMQMAKCDIEHFKYRKATPFWIFVRLLVPEIWKCAGFEHRTEREWALDRIVWSNVCKVGIKNDNPSCSFGFDPQFGIGRKLMKKEIALYRPTAIVLVCGETEPYYDFVTCLFGDKSGWCKVDYQENGQLWTRTLENGRARIYWAPSHPQRWNRASQKVAIADIAKDQSVFLCTLKRARKAT